MNPVELTIEEKQNIDVIFNRVTVRFNAMSPKIPKMIEYLQDIKTKAEHAEQRYSYDRGTSVFKLPLLTYYPSSSTLEAKSWWNQIPDYIQKRFVVSDPLLKFINMFDKETMTSVYVKTVFQLLEYSKTGMYKFTDELFTFEHTYGSEEELMVFNNNIRLHTNIDILGSSSDAK